MALFLILLRAGKTSKFVFRLLVRLQLCRYLHQVNNRSGLEGRLVEKAKVSSSG